MVRGSRNRFTRIWIRQVLAAAQVPLTAGQVLTRIVENRKAVSPSVPNLSVYRVAGVMAGMEDIDTLTVGNNSTPKMYRMKRKYKQQGGLRT